MAKNDKENNINIFKMAEYCDIPVIELLDAFRGFGIGVDPISGDIDAITLRKIILKIHKQLQDNTTCNTTCKTNDTNTITSAEHLKLNSLKKFNDEIENLGFKEISSKGVYRSYQKSENQKINIKSYTCSSFNRFNQVSFQLRYLDNEEIDFYALFILHMDKILLLTRNEAIQLVKHGKDNNTVGSVSFTKSKLKIESIYNWENRKDKLLDLKNKNI